MRKCLAVLLALVFSLTMGCATICQNQDKFFEYKGRIAAALAGVQVVYPIVLKVLDKEEMGPNVDFYLSKVQVIDAALDLIGQTLFDKFCPDEDDVAIAEAAADMALQAAAEMGAK